MPSSLAIDESRSSTPARVPVIAIDGPTASGKGTVAARVAAQLGFHYLDSGALYRRLALASGRAGLAPNNVRAIVQLLKKPLDELDQPENGDFSKQIRTEAIGRRASIIARHAPVRAALLGCQRAARQAPGLVTDGRDMGAVVFPDADLKVFLTASPETRAKRRQKQLMEAGFSVSIPTLLQDLTARDARDSARRAAPLVVAKDAKVLDTSELCIEAVVECVVAWFTRPKC